MESTLHLPMAIQVVGDDALVNGVGDHKSEHGDEEDAEPTRCVNPRVSWKAHHIFIKISTQKQKIILFRECSILVWCILSSFINTVQVFDGLKISSFDCTLVSARLCLLQHCGPSQPKKKLAKFHRNESSLTKPSDDTIAKVPNGSVPKTKRWWCCTRNWGQPTSPYPKSRSHLKGIACSSLRRWSQTLYKPLNRLGQGR